MACVSSSASSSSSSSSSCLLQSTSSQKPLNVWTPFLVWTLNVVPQYSFDTFSKIVFSVMI